MSFSIDDFTLDFDVDPVDLERVRVRKMPRLDRRRSRHGRAHTLSRRAQRAMKREAQVGGQS